MNCLAISTKTNNPGAMRIKSNCTLDWQSVQIEAIISSMIGERKRGVSEVAKHT